MVALLTLLNSQFFALLNTALFRIVLVISVLSVICLEVIAPQGSEPLSRHDGVLALLVCRLGSLSIIGLEFCGQLRTESRNGRDVWIRSFPIGPVTLVCSRFLGGFLAVAAYIGVTLLVPIVATGLRGGSLELWVLALYGEILRVLILLAFATLFAPRLPRIMGTGIVTALFFLGQLNLWVQHFHGTATDVSAMPRLLLKVLPKFDRFSDPLISQITGHPLPDATTLFLTCVYGIGYVFVCLTIASIVEYQHDSA